MKNSKQISERINSIEKELKLLEEGSRFRSMWKKGTASAPDVGANEEYYFRLLDNYFDIENGRTRLRHMIVDGQKTDLFDFDESILETIFPVFVTMYQTRGPRIVSVKESIQANDEDEAKLAVKELAKRYSGSEERITIEDAKGSLLKK